MFNELIDNFNKIVVYKDGKEYEVDGVKELFLELLDSSYFTSSLAIAEHNVIEEQKQKGIWLEIEYAEEKKYRDSRFEKLLIPLKPKYDYINLYRYYDREYQGRCFGLTLGIKTTALYNHIIGGIASGK
ncbi:MAG: hypothetical protein E7354_04815 [Clostridiales bacterium]|nr:hypothetical protein [Clostridiales bacterium]